MCAFQRYSLYQTNHREKREHTMKTPSTPPAAAPSLAALLTSALPYVQRYAGSMGAASIGDAGSAWALAGQIVDALVGESPALVPPTTLAANPERAAELLHAVGNSLERAVEGTEIGSMTIPVFMLREWREAVDMAAAVLNQPRGE